MSGSFSPAELNEIKQGIQELRQRGSGGAIAIREFLDSGQDVSFTKYAGGTPPEYTSLRLALIDTLAQMGDAETPVFMAGMLKITTQPEEVAVLARNLEQLAPGAYRTDILNSVRKIMDLAPTIPVQRNTGLGYAFGVIAEYGDASLAPELENVYRKSPFAIGEFALLALSKLSQGSGIPVLIRLADEMSGDQVTYGAKYDVALRILAQASRTYEQAGEALLRLAASNRVGTASLIRVAGVIGGTEHQLTTSSTVYSRMTRSELSVDIKAPETWSDTEIDQRISLIDRLQRTNPEPSAARALQDARSGLLAWKERPLVKGRRLR